MRTEISLVKNFCNYKERSSNFQSLKESASILEQANWNYGDFEIRCFCDKNETLLTNFSRYFLENPPRYITYLLVFRAFFSLTIRKSQSVNSFLVWHKCIASKHKVLFNWTQLGNRKKHKNKLKHKKIPAWRYIIFGISTRKRNISLILLLLISLVRTSGKQA